MQALLRPIRNRCMSRNRPRHGSQPRNCRLSPHQNLGRGKPRNRRVRYYGGITDGDTLLTMFGDFADLWERAAADGMPCARSSATTRFHLYGHSGGGSSRSSPGSERVHYA